MNVSIVRRSIFSILYVLLYAPYSRGYSLLYTYSYIHYVKDTPYFILHRLTHVMLRILPTIYTLTNALYQRYSLLYKCLHIYYSKDTLYAILCMQMCVFPHKNNFVNCSNVINCAKFYFVNLSL